AATRSSTKHRRQHQRGGDKGDIHGDEVNLLANVAGLEIPGISFLQQPNARVVAQPEIHLPVSGIHGNHSGGAVLQHAVAEASSGSPDVQTNFALEIDAPVLKRLLQFKSATADVSEILAQQAQYRRRAGVNRCACLLDFLLVDQDLSG